MVSIIGRKISTLASGSATSGTPEDELGNVFSAIAKPYLDPNHGLPPWRVLQRLGQNGADFEGSL